MNRREVVFTQSAPYASGPEVIRRLGLTEKAPAYDLAKEKLRILSPTDEATNAAWGLFVWVSPGDSPGIPTDWEPELARRKLLFVGAFNTGNARHPIDRFRLALDAVFNVRQRYRVDPRRVCVAGLSGGGRIASMLGVAYADVFRGTLAICGVNFYTTVPAGGGRFYPASYVTDPNVLSLARRSGRFVLLTGEQDGNRENTKAVCGQGFKRNGFANVLYLDVRGMKHSFPSAKVLATALNYLMADEPAAPAAAAR